MQKFKVSSEMQAEPLKQTPEEPKSKLQPFDVKWSGLNIAIAEEERKARPKTSWPNTKFCSLVSHILANSAITWAPAGLRSHAQGPCHFQHPWVLCQNIHHLLRMHTTHPCTEYVQPTNMCHIFGIYTIYSEYTPSTQNMHRLPRIPSTQNTHHVSLVRKKSCSLAPSGMEMMRR